MSGGAGAIERELAAAGFGDVPVHRFETLGSTSRWLEARVGASDAAIELCVTRHQDEGSGRRGRSWLSVPGDATFSLLERLPLAPAALGGLSLVTGIAAAETLRERCGIDVLVKWPNDLVVDGAKLGGLLTGVKDISGREEPGRGDLGRPAAGRPSSSNDVVEGSAASAVVSGIGINLVDDAARGAGAAATSLAALGVDAGDRESLIGSIAAAVLGAHANFAGSGWSVFGERWRALDRLAGREIRVLGDARHETGIALGVAADGALRLRVADGGERLVYAGEVSVRTLA